MWDSDVGYRRYNGAFPDCFRGHQGDSYSWADANGDNLVQPDEMKWVPVTKGVYSPHAGKLGRWTAIWGIDISREWTFVFAARFQDREVVYRVDPKSWTPVRRAHLRPRRCEADFRR